MIGKKEAIDKKVSAMLEIFSFDSMCEKFPDFCPCYKDKKPCHDIEGSELNCFFCFCPEYDNSVEEGGCKRSSKRF